MKKNIIVLLFSLALIIAVIIFYFSRRGYTPAISDGNSGPISQSIASLEKVTLGRMEQWILIRGKEIKNPILLWLHGGPGAAQMPVARYFNGELEEHFVIVHWDQRGAGKSNPANFDENTMTFQQFTDDAHELTVYLKKRFEREKIYLVGHSWGTQLGLKLAQAYPDDYYAYVGVSQVTDPERMARVGWNWLQEQVNQSGNEKDYKLLEEIGPPPYEDHDKFMKYIRMIGNYGGNFDVSMSKLLQIALRAPEYGFCDFIRWFRGANRGSGLMWNSPEYQSFNAIKNVPHLLVPAYFFCGRNDYNTPLKTTREYFELLVAPQGKDLVIFEKSAHTPFMAEPQRFNRELLRVREETFRKGRKQNTP